MMREVLAFDQIRPPFVPPDLGHGNPSTAKPQPPNIPLARLLPLRILIAEDNAVNQKVLTRMLAQLGYRADVVENGLEALQAVAERRYDLIFMDIRMPEMDGLAATQQLAAIYKPTARPIVIAVTAHISLANKNQCLEVGMDDFLTKPVRKDDIQNALERWGPIAVHRSVCSEGGAAGWRR